MLRASGEVRGLFARVDQDRPNATAPHPRGVKAVIDPRAAARLSAVVGDGEFPEHAAVADGGRAPEKPQPAAPPGGIAPVTAGVAALACLWAGARANHDFGDTIAHAAAAGGSFGAPTAAAGPMFGASRDPGEAGGDPAMTPKNSARVAAVAVAAAVTANGALAGDAVQWRVEDGGNGHWYQFFETANPRTWQAARDWAYTTGGHLVTITTAQEQAFIISIAPAYEDESGGQAWLGGYQDLNAPDYAETHGGWRWITGEPMNYQPWVNVGQSSPGSDFLTLGRDYLGRFGWNDIWTDYFGGRKFCFVEYDTDCNNDGIIDFGQMRDGTLPDANSNGVLDCCELAQSCCIGDIYIDGRINGADLGIVLAEWGPVTPTTHSDLDHNGRVDGADLGLLLSHWGPCGG